MADIRTSRTDEHTILQLSKQFDQNIPKYYILRLALSISLKITKIPDPEWSNKPEQKGSSYKPPQVTGAGKKNSEDHTYAYKSLLSVLHNIDLFNETALFTSILQAHIRRGLHELQLQIEANNNIHQYLLHTLFDDTPESHQESKEEQDNLEITLQSLGVACTINKRIDGPRISRYYIKLQNADQYNSLNKKLNLLTIQLGLKDRQPLLDQTSEPLTVSLDIPRTQDTWRPVSGDELFRRLEQKNPNQWILPVWPGVNVEGKPFGFDLAEAPHLLVGGATGSGKSMCLRMILFALVRLVSPKSLMVCLIDPKKVEFSSLSSLPHLFKNKVFTSPREILDIIREIREEMDSRMNKLKELGFSSLTAATECNVQPFPRLVVFVEELADLISREKLIEDELIRVAQMSRAAGIHLVLATQRPDAATFDGKLRSNAPYRIALMVQKSTESKIILDEEGAERLTGKGDMLVKIDSQAPIRLLGASVTIDEVLNRAQKF